MSNSAQPDKAGFSSLPRFARDMLGSCPSAGEGVHNWLFRCARLLHEFYPNKTELRLLLEAASANCGRRVGAREIDQAIANSITCAWQPGVASPSGAQTPRWPRRNDEQIEAIVRDGPGLADLWELSPLRLGEKDSYAEEVVDLAFPGNPLLCCGSSQSDFDTRPREDWRGQLSNLQFVVPNPMRAVWGQTKDGRESKHSLDNTGPRRFLVVEFDRGDFDQHASLLVHLGGMAPLSAVVKSGNKSLHGWFYCAGQSEELVAGFFRHAVAVGADPATWTRSQFVRLPEGRRDNGNRQSVMYMNPSTIKA